MEQQAATETPRTALDVVIEYRRAVEQDIDVLICSLLAVAAETASNMSGTPHVTPPPPTSGRFLVIPSCVVPTLTSSAACFFLRRCILDPQGMFVVATNDTQIIAFAYGSNGGGNECTTAAYDSGHPFTVVMAWANARYRAVGEQLVHSLRLNA